MAEEETIDEKADEKMYSIVTTTRAKYFGEVQSNGRKGIAIDSAFEVGAEKEPQEIALAYLRGKMYGENKKIELSDALVESVSDAIDETRILKTYEALIPEAEKRAIGVMTYKALEDLLTK